MPLDDELQNPDDDNTERYKAYREKVENKFVDDEMESLFGTPREFQKRPESMSMAPRVYNPPDEDDPQASLFERFVDDVATGLVNAPLQVVGGIADAITETGDTIEDIGSLLGAEFEIPDLPTTDKIGSITGSLIRSTAQFLVGFIPAARAVKAIRTVVPGREGAERFVNAALKDRSQFTKKFTGFMGQVIEAEVAGAAATMVVFDPHEDRLSTFLNTVPGLSEIIPDYLADNNPENETVWEGRIKNAVEGAAIGAFAGGLMSVFRAYKGNRINPQVPADETINVEGGPKVEEPRASAEPVDAEVAPAPDAEVTPAKEVVPPENVIGLDEFKKAKESLLALNRQIDETLTINLSDEAKGALKNPVDDLVVELDRLMAQPNVSIKEVSDIKKRIASVENKISKQPGFKEVREEIAALDLDKILKERGASPDAEITLTKEAPVTDEEFLRTASVKVVDSMGAGKLPDLKPSDFTPDELAALEAKGIVPDEAGAFNPQELEAFTLERAGATPEPADLNIDELINKAKNIKRVVPDDMAESLVNTKTDKTFLTEGDVPGRLRQKLGLDPVTTAPAAKGRRPKVTNLARMRLKMDVAEDLSERGADLGNTAPRESINIATLDPENPIGDLLQKKIAQNKPLIDALKNGDKQTIAQWKDGAQERFRQVEDYLGKPLGLTDPEEVLAAGELLENSSQILIDRVRLATMPDATDADIARFAEMEAMHNLLLSHFEAGASQAGRTFRALREVRETFASLNRVRETNAGRIDDIEAAMRRLGGSKAARDRANAYILGSETPSSMNKMVRDFNKPNRFDALYETFINGILSGPGTHFRNIVSTQSVSVLSVPETAWNAAISKIFLDGELSFAEVGARVHGYKEGWRKAYRLAREGNKAERIGHLDLEFDFQKQIEIAHPNAMSAQTFELDPNSAMGYGVDMLGRFTRFPTKMLNAEDKWHKTMGYFMELEALAVRKGKAEGLEGSALDLRREQIIDNPPESLHIEALDAAHYMTFTNKLPLGFQRGVDALRKIPGGRFIVPFIRTPTNILKFAFERTPFVAMTQGWKDSVARGGADAAQAWGRMTLGSTAMMGFAAMTMEGILTGPGPENKDMRRALMATGWRPNSVRVGDLYVPYDKLDPIGNTMAWGAAIGEMVNNLSDEDADFVVANAVAGFGANLASERYLRGLFDVIGAIDPSNPVKTPEGWLQRFLPSVVPYSSLLRGVARAIDPDVRIRRTAVGDPDLNPLPGIPEEFNVWMDDTLANLRSGIPGLSSGLPLDRDLEGKPIENPAQIWAGLDFINPNWASVNKTDKPSTVIRENKIGLSRVSRFIRGVELTGDEYSEMQRVAGEFYASEIGFLVNSSGFDSLSSGPEGMKALQVKGLIKKSRAIARQVMIDRTPELRNRILSKQEFERQQLIGQTEEVDFTPGNAAFPMTPKTNINEDSVNSLIAGG